MVTSLDIDPQLLQAFDEIQQPRTDYELSQFVVGARYTQEQKYAQCVLELQVAYDALRMAKLECELKQLEIDELPDTKLGCIKKKMKLLELEQTRRAVLGKSREFTALYKMWQAFPKRYTREELTQAQPSEFQHKLFCQAAHDIAAYGHVMPGNQEGLRQLGVSPEVFNRSADKRIDDVERRYLAQGKVALLIGIPTEKKPDRIPALEGLIMPGHVEYKPFCLYGRPVDEAYTFIVREAMNTGANYLLTLEDDTFPPADALTRLFETIKKYPKSVVGAWYPKRSWPREGVHIVIDGTNERGPMIDDGTVKEAYTLAMGCTLYPMQIFADVAEPWFKTTSQLTQDSYFSQKAREAGWRLLVDTSIRCKHIDRVTGESFE
jgi:hypothetical protein